MEADLCRGLIVSDKEIPLRDLRAFRKIREKLDMVRLRTLRQHEVLFDEKPISDNLTMHLADHA
jgi:hypothetical protein